MKFVISSAQLSQRLLTLGRILGKTTMPILNNFLLQISANRLIITASDGEIRLHSEVELIESDQDFEFTINAKTLQDAIKEINDQPITFSVDTENLQTRIDYHNGYFHLIGQSAAEYPRWKELENADSSITANTKRVHDALSRVAFAAAQESIRPAMNGILFEHNEQGLTLVATDTRYLAYDRMTDLPSSTPVSFILPKKLALLLRNMLQHEEGDLTCQFNRANVCFQTSNYKMFCRLIDADYPNYNSVIPTNNPYHIILNRSYMATALRRVLILANAGSPLLKLSITSGQLKLSARDIDYGYSSEETVPCSYDGAPIEIGFKGPMLLELFTNLDCEEVELQLADPSRAGLLKPTPQLENEEITMLQMPMMLND